MSDVNDRWAAGATYEDFMGRWSRELAPRFLSWLQAPSGLHWLDVGCGTGALTEAIGKHASPASVVGCDPSEPFVEYAREHHEKEGMSFVVGGAGLLPKRHGGFGSVTSSLVLNFFPAPAAAIEEMRGITSDGGLVSACVWDYSGRMDFLRHFWDVAARVDPNARDLDEGNRFPVCRPQALIGLFQEAGLHDVSCDPIDVPTLFSDFDECWKPFLGRSGPAPSYVASLDPDKRAALRSELEQALPAGTDGTIDLIARAWAVKGTVV